MKTTAIVKFALIVPFSKANKEFEKRTKQLAISLGLDEPKFDTDYTYDADTQINEGKDLKRYLAKFYFEISKFDDFLHQWDYIQSLARYQHWQIDQIKLTLKHPDDFDTVL
jgi:hypothetical protein